MEVIGAKMAKVSIIVPVYRVENYLDKCVTSLINQTLKDIEIILVDDGSTDNSSKIADEYKEKNKNKPSKAARNNVTALWLCK